jgi:hypothetical protein
VDSARRNIIKAVAAFDPLSLRYLLPEGGPSLVSATIRPNGHPVVTLSDGNALSYDAALRTWIRLSASTWWAKSSSLWETRARSRTLATTRGVVRHLEGTVNDLVVSGAIDGADAMDTDVEGDPVPRPDMGAGIGEGKPDWGATLALGHLEARLSSAVSLDSPAEYRQSLGQVRSAASPLPANVCQRVYSTPSRSPRKASAPRAKSGCVRCSACPRPTDTAQVRELLGPVYLCVKSPKHVWNAVERFA